ncbi:uncharacterized protein LOC130813512 [Amaranthus tricolor]|uniref:uncharacterized protein LOC130813512 n=1 Tax=Amaranthus tricolor TaxID=29722 RepID=UPI0025842E5B|nr:uncharacterized protein LOC130813512 [Amaranthus tricolor]
MMFDSKEALLEAIRVYYIPRNVEYRTETSIQIVITLKCKRGCSWRLWAMLDSYSIFMAYYYVQCEGFNHGKPLIAIDGTHLYGKYPHTLLIGIAQDGDKGIFPLAFALVEKECIGAWSWFIACIRKHVTQRMGLWVNSDRHADILATMEEPEWQPPYAHHRLCLRHLLSNFNHAMGNVQPKKLFGRIFEQRQQAKLMNGLKTIGIAKREAIFWIDEVGDMSKWSLCHDGGYRYGITNTNLVEVFNFVIMCVRFLPLTTLVEFTFYKVNDYLVS